MNHQPISEIKKLAAFLYHLRSEFVHQAKVANLLNGKIVSTSKAGLIESNLKVVDIFRAFELGVIEHFRGKA